MNSNRWRELIEAFALQKHPEGGYYSRNYRSSLLAAVEGEVDYGTEKRSIAGAILYLLPPGDFSAFHRVKQDELWHFYEGSSAVMHLLSAAGDYECLYLGADFAAGERRQALITGGTMFAVEPVEHSAYSFFGCSTFPAFCDGDLWLPTRAELYTLYPEHKELINRLACDAREVCGE